jgi:mono/diheme cytochrome c family protein
MKLPAPLNVSFMAAFAVAIFAPLTLSAASPTQRGAMIHGDSGHGAGIFSTWCTSCHAVDIAATDQIPSAPQLANDPGHTDSVIRGFLVHPHKPMPPLNLSTQEIEDIIAYLHTLQAKKGQKH